MARKLCKNPSGSPCKHIMTCKGSLTRGGIDRVPCADLARLAHGLVRRVLAAPEREMPLTAAQEHTVNGRVAGCPSPQPAEMRAVCLRIPEARRSRR